MSTALPTAYSNPEVFAKKYPHTRESAEFARGKYDPSSTWIPRYLDPSWKPPATMAT